MQLDPAAGEPLFLQISRAITNDIQRGRLRPGARLPGTRSLAQALAVHRNTVISAYAELISEGWIETSPARATFIARSLPTSRPRAFTRNAPALHGRPAGPGYDLRGAGSRVHANMPSDTLVMNGGIPDVRLAPVTELSRAYGRALRQDSRTVLSYGDPYGHPRLRAALAAMLTASRGLATGPDDVLVTGGSQMALNLVGRALVAPGDVVAVEALGYGYACEAFRQYGARLAPIPVDEHGLRVDMLEQLVERTPIRAIHITPHHQYPTMVTMSAARRVALLALAQRKRFAIIEDDYDHEFHYEGRPVLPLASADRAAVVVYIGTLSKILAPGVRLGYVVAPKVLLERLASQRVYVDRHGDQAVELAVAHLLEDGTVQRSARRARRIYHARRDLLAHELRRTMAGVLSFDLPSGGMAIWTKVSPQIDADAWAARALERKVAIRTARSFALDARSRPYVRLGFAALDERELTVAVKRLNDALESMGRPQRRAR